ncbi:MAG: aromatic amino acid lyase, partial [Propionivibrio sp.]
MDVRVKTNRIEIGARRLAIEDVLQVARGGAGVALSAQPEFARRIRSGAAYLARLLADNGIVYGVNTGYGDSCTVSVPPELVAELPLHLTRYHGCGLGEHLDEEATLAVLVCRLNSLAQGYSGVRWELLEQLAALIEHRVLPLIPCEGSVGASGDLTPLSYVAAALIGEREVVHAGTRRSAADALQALGRAPLKLA